MQATSERVVLIPRYSSYAGAGTFLTPPMNVRDFESANFIYTLSGALGVIGPTVTVEVEESPDLSLWYPIGAALFSGDVESRSFQFEWMRLKITLSGADPAFTCWCVGDFIRRR